MEFLMEILTEELPVSHVKTALDQLSEKFRRELQNSGLSSSGLRFLGTCRRLVVLGDIAPGLESAEEVVSGPPKAVGLLADGTFSQAARGFARAQGVPLESLIVVTTPKGEYLGFKKTRQGTAASDILRGFLPGLLSSISFPKTMRWRDSSFRFSRPIHGLLCLVGGRVLDMAWEGFKAGDTTRGHRIQAPEAFRVSGWTDYEQSLRERKVILDPEERGRMVASQMDKTLAPLQAAVLPDPYLFDYVRYSVEYPFVFMGEFPDKYLSLPLEVLSTAMREGQKLFSIVRDKKQIPRFLGVADTWEDSRSLVRKGNERVLKARLEDARFFWEHDRKIPLTTRSAGLGDVIFQEKLGSYDDKTQRLKKLVAYLCDRTGMEKIKKEAVLAASLCKADLLTDMVKEFPSLQGRMGGLYARQEGMPAAVAQGIYEHYQPAGLEDDVPASPGGSLLALSDKLDSTVGVLGLGTQVTGSSDPFGLRRNAHGVCKILLDKKLSISFPHLLDKALALYGDRLPRSRAEVKSSCLDFFSGRLRFILERENWRYDLVGAALGPGIDDIYHVFLRVKALDGLKASPNFEAFILMAKRVNNILRGQPVFKVNPALFQEKEERELFSNYSIIRDNVDPMIAKGDFSRAQNMTFKIQPALSALFDKVLVMAPEPRLRRNRLALLQAIRELLARLADYSQVVVEGEKPAKC